jgi:hypothetical protein
MALQLPPPRDPPAPADPPTLADIYEARRYTNNIITSRSKLVIHFTTPMLTISRRLAIAELNRASIDDVGRAILYESSAADIGPGS